MAKQPKLKTLLEDIFNEQPQINKYEVTEGVRSYGIVGKALYNNGNIMGYGIKKGYLFKSNLVKNSYLPLLPLFIIDSVIAHLFSLYISIVSPNTIGTIILKESFKLYKKFKTGQKKVMWIILIKNVYLSIKKRLYY